MKYKIYEMVKTTFEQREENFTPITRFIVEESELNYGCGFDSFEEAAEKIKKDGHNYINYTIMPYVYMVD